MSKNSNIIVFIGPPGSGKGSISKLFLKRFGWSQLSTGNLCRQHIDQGTEIGKQIDLIIKSGKLISDSLMIDMVNHWINTELAEPKTVIFDGFPRTGAQAEAFSNLLKFQNFNKIDIKVIRMLVKDETLISRLSARFICQDSSCQAVYSINQGSCSPKIDFKCDECSSLLVRRPDDEEHAIRERLKIYHKHEQDILSFYNKIGHKVNDIEVEKPLEHVFEDLIKFLGIKEAQ